MRITGQLFLAQNRTKGFNGTLQGISAKTGEKLEPDFGGASQDDLKVACAAAWEAFPVYRAIDPERRAAFLETIAQNILDLGDELVDRASLETGLPQARIQGERGRTVGQLRMFADVVRYGAHLDLRIDPAQPERTPAPRPDLRLRNIPLGPVAVFGASNFPLAFSVAGGDSASALAAGCPVIVKAHSAHPGTSELVGTAIAKAVRECAMPAGTFSLLFDTGKEIGQGLVADPRIKAVGFTGSRGGGTALTKIAQSRPVPIPVYAEMSSINPIFLLEGALSERAEEVGAAFVASLTLGAGQFCTNPGLVIALKSDALERFVAAAADGLKSAPAQTMLTPGIHQSYWKGVESLRSHERVQTVAQGTVGGPYDGVAGLFRTTGAAFLANPDLQEEIFGATGLLVECGTEDELLAVLDQLEGQLTAAVHVGDRDDALAQQLLPLLELKVGRILFNDFGTGVDVGHAMVHGGPYPSTSDGCSTSVGSKAIERFMRPVSYQDVPQALLPVELRDGSGRMPLMYDGKLRLSD